MDTHLRRVANSATAPALGVVEKKAVTQADLLERLGQYPDGPEYLQPRRHVGPVVTS
jgi:hypothetical protein